MICDYKKLDYERLLDGMNTLVTGGTSAIGREIALLYAKHGAIVAITDIDEEKGLALEKELKAIEPRCFFVKADLSKDEDIDAMCAEVISRMGTVYTLVNNAGIFEGGYIEGADMEAFERMYRVNVVGSIRTTRNIVPAMIKGQGGNIVNILSDYAIRGCPGVSLFAATKGAVYSFSRSIAIELSKYDIRSNCILPGMNITSHGDRFIEQVGEEEAAADFDFLQPLKGRGTAEDVANAALFLGSQMSRFLTADAVEVNGGIDARAHKQGMHPNEVWKVI